MVAWMARMVKAGDARLFTGKRNATVAFDSSCRNVFRVPIRRLPALIMTKYLLRLLEINVAVRLFQFQSAFACWNNR